jgi:hypothetical protein
MNYIYMPRILRRLKEREEVMEDKKVRPKHVGFAGQREFCRNNKHAYTEKINETPVLMCNYPFPDPYHKKGVCRANTCTDMREIPQEITEADAETDVEKEVKYDDRNYAGQESQEEESIPCPSKVVNLMPCPSNE